MAALVKRSLTFTADGNVVYTEGNNPPFKGKSSVFAAAVIKKNAPEVTASGVPVKKPTFFTLTGSDGKEYKLPFSTLAATLDVANKDHLPFGSYTVTVEGGAEEEGLPIGMIVAGVAGLGALYWFFGRR